MDEYPALMQQMRSVQRQMPEDAYFATVMRRLNTLNMGALIRELSPESRMAAAIERDVVVEEF